MSTMADGLNMQPRIGEPNSNMIPGMAAPLPPAAAAVALGGLPSIGLLAMADTSGPPPVATQTPQHWTYDFNAAGISTANFPGNVSFGSGGPAAGTVTTFNTRSGAVTLTQADVTAVAVGSFNTRTGAVVLSQADVSAVAVGSFNTRTGAVVLTQADVSAVGIGPSFSAYLSASTANNVTGDGTVYSVICNTEDFDIGNCFAAGILTAVTAGKYFVCGLVTVANLGAAHLSGATSFLTSDGRTFVGPDLNPFVMREQTSGLALLGISFSAVISLALNQTVSMRVGINASTKTVGVSSTATGGTDRATRFSGFYIGP